MKKVVVLFFVLAGYLATIHAQVNMPTGSAVFSLPMFEWKDAISRLSSSVSLNYNSGGGLKTNSVASNVGQGWNMEMGGVITRMQIGEPDDQPGYEGDASPHTIEDETKYPPGFLYNSKPAIEGCPIALTKYPIFGDKNHLYKQHNVVAADRELDQFAFQFNGRTGMFVLKKGEDIGLLLSDSRIKIWFLRDQVSNTQTRTAIGTFFIQDENGLIYKFDKRELTRIIKTSPCDWDLSQQYTQPNMKKHGVYHENSFDYPGETKRYVITSWYLSEIKDPLTLRTITFSYEMRDMNSYAGAAISYYLEKDYSIVTHSRSITKTPILTSIAFPDGHQVNFNYGALRVDLKDDRKLASVDIIYGSRYLSRYELNTSYFILNRIGNPESDFQKKNARLCLRSVQRIGVDLKEAEPPHIFNYYLGSNGTEDFVPPPFSPVKDVWGYYNGSLSTSSQGDDYKINSLADITKLDNNELKGLCFLRGTDTYVSNPKEGYAKNGLLKQIIYPAGGALAYEYEQNEATYIGGTSQVMIGGVHVSRTKQTDGGYDNDCNNPVITNYKYNLDGSAAASSMWGVEKPLSHMELWGHYSPEKKYFYYKPLFKFGCDYSYKYPGILSREQAISLTGNQQFMVTLSKVMDIVSSVLTVIDIVSVCIKATPAAIIAVILDFIASLANVIISCTVDQTKDSNNTIYYDSDVNGANPLPGQFKRVEVTRGDGSSGKTVYKFTSDDDYYIWEPDNPSFSRKQRFGTWAYGLPRFITVLDAAGNKVKETENEYSFTRNDYAPHPGVPSGNESCKCSVKKSYSMRDVDWRQPVFYDAPGLYQTESNSDMMVDVYSVYSGRAELATNYERVYKPGNASQYMQTVKRYSYNYNNYLPSNITTTESDGNATYEYLAYSGDFSDGVFATLNNNNMSSLLVSKNISCGNSTTYLGDIGSSRTEFGLQSNGDIKETKLYERRYPKPMRWYDDEDPPAEIETQAYTYNTQGYLVQMKDEGSHIVSNIYDYDNKYVVGSLINADINVDKPAYSSFETTTLGGWSLNGTAVYNANSITGTRSFVLSGSNSLSAAINQVKAYRISFWSSNNVTVTGNATLKISEPVINGFTYYEYEIAAGTTSVNVSGNAFIDELRLYPMNARIRTVTYDPLIGKTSECDENNRITYYEYDAIGKLRFIKDEHKNIIKMYEYNYANNLQKACPHVYSNSDITEVFTKNNCGDGFIGASIQYHIAAGKYTSTVSQDVVDRAVEDELKQLGQVTANAGACIPIYKNDAKSQVFTKECGIGYSGTSYTYSVPEGRYKSLVSKEDANNRAQYEIDANGQYQANLAGNATCIVSSTPVYQADNMPQTRCQQINSLYTGHQEVYMKDINPNSSTYNQWSWQDIGASSGECTVIYARVEYENFVDYVDQEFADIVVRFYADAGCTVPMSVNNLSVNYRRTMTIYAPGTGVSTFNNDYNLTANGTSATIVNYIRIFYDEYQLDRWTETSFNLLPGAYEIKQPIYIE